VVTYIGYDPDGTTATVMNTFNTLFERDHVTARQHHERTFAAEALSNGTTNAARSTSNNDGLTVK
jgi:hypothetical protein